MTDFELTSDTVQGHAQVLTDIAGTVENAGTAGRTRVGAGDFGAMFAPLMLAVNVALEQVGGAVSRHAAELAAHRRDFERTARELVASDDSGATGMPR